MPDEAVLMAPPVRPGHEYVLDMLGTLWPAPAVVRRAGAGAMRSADHVAQFVALPGSSRPRALVPRSPRAASATALRQLTAGAGRAARARSAGLGWLAALGLVRALPQGFVITAPPGAPLDDIGTFLTRVLARPLALSLKIGPVRAVQKPVLHLIAPEGGTIGFAKIGATDFTAALVRTEASALRLLGASTWAHLQVPEVLHHGQWRGHEVLVQQPLEGRPWAGEREALAAAMIELARSQGVSAHHVRDSPWWARIGSRLESLDPGPAARILAETAALVETSRGEEMLGFGSWHTDWAPWNLAMSGSRVMVWDWEQFEQDVPLGLDAVHFELQRLVVVESVEPREAYRRVTRMAPELLAGFGVPVEQSALTVALYLLESTSRYLQDGESGTRLSRVDLWLADTLADVVDAVQRERGGVEVERAHGHG